MAERRSMGQALSLTPEKMDFISRDIRDAEPEEKGPVKVAKAAKPEQAPEPQITRRSAPSKPHHSTPNRSSLESDRRTDQYGALVQLSCRLRPELVHAIRKALFERKLDGEVRLTQQEIVEEALTEWLTVRGHLDT